MLFRSQEELHRREYDFSLQQAVPWTFGAQGLLSTLTKGLDPSRVITEVDLDDDFFTRLKVGVSLANDLGPIGIAALTVNVEYPADRPDGAPPVHHDGWVFRPGPTEGQIFQCWLDPAKHQAYRYQLEVAYAPDSPWQGTTSGARSPWMSSTARELTINPLDGLALLDVRVVSGLSGDAIPQAQVELRYEVEGAPPLAELFFVKPGDAPRSWKIRLADPTSRTVRAKITWSLAGGGSIEGEWTTSDDGIVVVPSPFQDRVRVRVFCQLAAAELVEALVVLRYADEAHGYAFEKQLSFTPASLSAQSVDIPIFGGASKEWSWELTAVKSTGQVLSRSGTSAEAALVLRE